MSTRQPSPWQLEQAMSVLLSVRRRLLDDDPDIGNDERLFAGMLEGESGDAMDVIDNVIRASIEAASRAQAAKDIADHAAERAARYKRRAEALRGAAFAALSALDLRRLERPDFTATIGNGQRAVVITDEAALDRRFIRVTEAPDKAAIAAALKAGETVEGATMQNANPVLTVRVR